MEESDFVFQRVGERYDRNWMGFVSDRVYVSDLHNTKKNIKRSRGKSERKNLSGGNATSPKVCVSNSFNHGNRWSAPHHFRKSLSIVHPENVTSR